MSSPATTKPLLYATTAAGCEDLLVSELRLLGMTQVRAGRGVVAFGGGLKEGLKASLWLRSAMRVLMPIGTVSAQGAEVLYEQIRELDWASHLSLSSTFAVEISGRNRELEHTHFAALKVKDAIVDSLRARLGGRPSVNPKDPDVLIIGRIEGEHMTLSLDISGEPLFKRGYRVRSTPATLKETLGAAILLASRYDGRVPLADPMCGSGTVAIEAAMIAQNIAPGLWRKFGAERWPSFSSEEQALLRELRDEARTSLRRRAPEIWGSDRDPEAVKAAEANARRFGLPLRFQVADARKPESIAGAEFVVSNAPYGERLDGGGRKQLKTFFWQLGQNWRDFSGRRISILAGGPDFESAFGMRPSARRKLFNGPIEATLLRYDFGKRGE